MSKMNGHRFGVPMPDIPRAQEPEQPWFQRIGGTRTTKKDPDRLLWYGPCFYWTDDWNQVGRSPIHSIPCCPVCGAVGFQITFREWIDGAEKFSAETNQPGYTSWLLANQEVCLPDMSMWQERSKSTEERAR